MSTFSFSAAPPREWDSHCARHRALFHSSAWQGLLEQAFNCETAYGWSPDTHGGVAVTNFKAGPFRVGYLGFPVGGLIGSGKLEREVVMSWRHARLQRFTRCLRIPASAFDNPTELGLPYQSNPETAIDDLQDWDLASVSRKLRRDIKKAQRSGITIRNAADPAEGRSLYQMYRDTVTRRGGALRYNEKYFSNLIALAHSHPDLQCFIGQLGDAIAGFVVAGRHVNTAYYLHGGTNFDMRRHSPSDLLLLEAISWAKDGGSQCFNLMSSSREQPSLIRYKEKWGATTKDNRTYTLSLNLLFCLPFTVAERVYRLLRQ